MWYKLIILVLALCSISFAIPYKEADNSDNMQPLPKSLSQLQHEREIKLVAAMESGAPTDSTTAAPVKGPNMGKAMLLSAIMPGTGQLYIGSKWKGYTFLGIEAAAWTMAIMYNVKGNQTTKDFQNYAESHWGVNESLYRQKEFYYATLNSLPSRISSTPYQGTRADWDLLSWDDKSKYLPSNFTHELPSSHNQQWYEMIGKYLTQFGPFWDDADTSSSAYSATGVWSGSSTTANKYADKRYDANKQLKAGNTMFMVVMINHVLSATDAVLSVKAMNNRTVQTAVRLEQRSFNNEVVTMPTLHITF